MKKAINYLALLMFFSLLLVSCKEDPPVAAFTCDKTSGNVPLTVKFSSVSTGEISSYSWVFGDGTTSDAENPSHTYNNYGTYTAVLTVTGPGGTNSSSTTITVTTPAPVSVFTSNNNSGCAPFTVTFTSNSTGVISSYSWNFGDGGTSTVQNPSHTFNNSGTYSVSLTVTGPGGSNSSSKTISVIAGSEVTFNNPAYTTIYVTLGGITKTVAPSGSVTFNAVSGQSAGFSAYTNGTTSTGDQVGLRVTWSGTLILNCEPVSYNLNVASSNFFLYIKNSGGHKLVNLYVNYGLVSQTYDNILISNNGIRYSLGYYKAYTNSNVRMYYQDIPTSYVYWNQGNQFTLPWTSNQIADLVNTLKSATVKDADYSDGSDVLHPETAVSNLLPAPTIIYKHDPHAIDLDSK